MSIIAFYGSENRPMFAIERAAMDKPGLVIEHLDAALPDGLILDVGAGDGFTAHQLTRPDRTIFCLEPAIGMMNRSRDLEYIQGTAGQLPFQTGSVDGIYATWAYFFPGYHDIAPGLVEIERVARPGTPLVIIDNYGGDEFSALLGQDQGVEHEFWADHGYSITRLDTVFEFFTPDEARRLMSFYAGRDLGEVPRVIEYQVAVMTKAAGVSG